MVPMGLSIYALKALVGLPKGNNHLENIDLDDMVM